MLQTQTVDAATLELLISLQQKRYLDNFYLVGGTALALYYGHRKSVDIDLFTNQSFDTISLLEKLQTDYPIQLFHTATGTIKGHINNVNVDFIAHRYPYLEEPFISEGITLLSEKDIIAMKLNAICVSGQRSKDFIDVYYAMERHSLADMVLFYQRKYNQQGDMHIVKSLVFFDDVDLTDWPVLIKTPEPGWNQVKSKLKKAVLDYSKNKKE
ncbi:MAG: nucleotidyl transferase AbiEii/AbiGii toxin family protein [Bacteroidales bacterium]